ncbi:protein kinase [Parafrankia sp. EUN1f]|uniref:protein kinase domain-containing protein n=1 Tax=Parafrankia sp. EUN1f TaxID=102897 RepID=UPI0001C467D2|nr:protein kinase [Parafrankia sp. EUN1f]EFC81094.1 serine/threonine protein kinase [Parafrankia sp. EUN1f]
MLSSLSENDPTAVGRYQLHGRLGSGGMGTVYLGFSPEGTPAAIKVVRPDLCADQRFRVRFAREVGAARRVRGRCVAQLLDADVDAPQPWMATEYIDGVDLATAIGRRGPITGPNLTAFAVGLADALVSVHAAALAHRDLKPANILLAWDGPKIIDFGIATEDGSAGTLTGAGQMIGTVSWMSPEQYGGQQAGPPADVFTWALCVGFAATGRHPFDAPTPQAIMVRVLTGQPDLSAVPAGLAAVLGRALEREPAHRPTAAGLLAALTELADGAPDDGTRSTERTRDILASWVLPVTPAEPVPGLTAGPLPGTPADHTTRVESPLPGAPAGGSASGGGSGGGSGGPAGPGHRLGRTPVLAVLLVGVLVAGVAVVGVLLTGLRQNQATEETPGRASLDPSATTTAPVASATTATAAAGKGAVPVSPSPAAEPGLPAGTAPPADGSQQAGGPGSVQATASAPLPRATAAGRPRGAGRQLEVLSGSSSRVPVYAGPSTSVFGGQVATLPARSTVAVHCGVYGQTVTARGATSPLWVYTDSGWISDTYTHTGTTDPVVPACVHTLSDPRLGDGPPRPAAGPYAVAADGVLPVRANPRLGAASVASLRDGDLVTLRCRVRGDEVGPPARLHTTSSDWNQLASGGYIPDANVYSDTATSVAPAC